MRQKEGGGHDNFSNGPLGSRDTELTLGKATNPNFIQKRKQ